jgi:hypothetical protein
MVPSFFEILFELNKKTNITIYKSAQQNEWGIIKDHMFLITVSETEPHDEFLEFYVNECST